MRDSLQTPLTQIASERLALVNRRVGIANNSREHIHDISRGITLQDEMPRHADLVDAPAGDLKRPKAFGDERAALDLAARGGDHDPVQVGNAFLGGELGWNLGETFGLKLSQ